MPSRVGFLLLAKEGETLLWVAMLDQFFRLLFKADRIQIVFSPQKLENGKPWPPDPPEHWDGKCYVR
jgi:hypothetical protein